MKHKFLSRKLNPETEILIVGTFNPDVSKNSAKFFYSRGHTSFWELMSAIFGEKCLRYSEEQEMKLPGLTPGVSFHPNKSIVRPKSSFPCISMYFRICSSFIPTVDTKYPSDQIPSLP